ncbi:hypothetical protein C2S53_016442 [Perilla frutescens var. hirtella]|uniref:Myb/SANT-like domain-containing protein n=1 Tax=Perilla frutescens var. hirtella TaxID=608512 RepID=A0AAD4J626_PERFH|nr:hypothetical protein C2S53_016442 [Perilla frutescens var. hirtella]
MGDRRGLTQDGVFYTGQWTREVERIVLGKWQAARSAGNFSPKRYETSSDVIRSTRLQMIEEFGFQIPMASYEWKLNQLARRYHEFKKLISRPDVQYDQVLNRVEASSSTWEDIAKTQPNLMIYKHAGEPHWSYLKVLYEPIIDITSSVSGEQEEGRGKHRGESSDVSSRHGRRVGSNDRRVRGKQPIRSSVAKVADDSSGQSSEI